MPCFVLFTPYLCPVLLSALVCVACFAGCLLPCSTQQNFGPVLGHGIFTSDGADWYWQRKLAINIFSVKRWVVANEAGDAV